VFCEEHAMTVFALMDEWIAATGQGSAEHSDAWLALGLELLDGWQRLPGASTRGDPPAGQAHLSAVLAALHVLRPVRPEGRPDPVALAAWFHHAAAESGGPATIELSGAFAYDAIRGLGQPLLGRDVARLVRLLGRHHPDRDDLPGLLLCSAHRSALSVPHLASVPRMPSDQ
jgi:hypothetical protein